MASTGAEVEAEIDPQLPRHDLGQGWFCAEGREAHGEEHMVQGFAPRLGGVDKDFQIFARLGLADKIRQRLGTHGGFQRVVFLALGRQPAGQHRSAGLLLSYRAMPASASFSSTPVSAALTW